MKTKSFILIKLFALGMFFMLCTNIMYSQNDEFFSKEYFIQNEDTLQYRMMLPKDFSDSKSYPLVIFLHGANDDVVNPQASVEMVSGILKYGGKPNFSLFAKDNHNSWDSAFAEPELLSWLFSNTKSNQ